METRAARFLNPFGTRRLPKPSHLNAKESRVPGVIG